jgi:hypothetical protein
VVLFVSQSASLGWLFLVEVWVVMFLFGQGSRGRNPFGRRLDQLLVLLVPQAETTDRGTVAALGQDSIRAFGRAGQPWWVERVCSTLASPASGHLRTGLSGRLRDDLYASEGCPRQ